MLERTANRIRDIVYPPAADTSAMHGTASIYASSEQQRSGHELTDDRSGRSLQGRLLGRMFGLIWLGYLIGAFPALVREDIGPGLAIPAWAALILFVVGYVTITLFGTPLWATSNPRDQRTNRAIVVGMIASLLLLVVLLPSWNLGYVFIYCTVAAGIFLVRREAIWVVVLCTVLSILSGIYEHTRISDVFTAGLLVGGIGLNSAFWSALMAQNRALRRARAEVTRLAITEERLRIARDLHDLLGHNLSIITLKSELAGRLLASHPDRAASEIDDVQHVARTALQEVREAVAGYRAIPLTSEIDHARQMLQAAGVQFSTRIAVQPLPMEIDHALAWFTREGTTNIIRHANATSATLRIDQLGDQLFAEYTDNGRPGQPCPRDATPQTETRAPNGRFGLIGLGERMRMLGGEFTASPMPEHGFRLAVIIPLPPPTTPERPPVVAQELAS